MKKQNVLEFSQVADKDELFEELAGNEQMDIERIISTGQTTPKGEWLCQKKTEFVLLLAGHATLKFCSGESFEMKVGDHLLIPPNVQHRVEFTQKDPATIWLAVHY